MSFWEEDKDTQGEDSHVTMEAEIGMMQFTNQGTPRIASATGSKKKQGMILSYRFQREYDPTNTLILDF